MCSRGVTGLGVRRKGWFNRLPRNRRFLWGAKSGAEKGAHMCTGTGDCGLWGGGWNSGQSSSAL